MKKELDRAFMKKTLIASIVATAIWLACFIVFIPLACKGIVPSEASRYLSCISVLFMIWVPFAFVFLRVKFDFTVFIVYLVFIFLATLVGSGFSVYHFVSWYDTVIHFLSGVVIGFVGYTLFSQNSKERLNYVWLFIFVVAFAMLCGGMWEIYEFMGDLITGSDMQVSAGFVGQKALMDTMIDIICDFGGGLVAAVCCIFLERNKRKVKPVETVEGDISQVNK